VKRIWKVQLVLVRMEKLRAGVCLLAVYNFLTSSYKEPDSSERCIAEGQESTNTNSSKGKPS